MGWLGLHKEAHLANPMAVNFMENQLERIYVIGTVIILLAALVTFFLSRHLLKPIQRLAEGTRALSSRKFDFRIKVNSSDELGQLSTDFNQMILTLKQYEDMRQQWVSDIAHELRTPLLIISGEIEALMDGIREVNNETLGSLYSETRHLGKIVNDLHDLSLADSGALTIKQEQVDPLTVLNKTIINFKPRFAERNIVINNNPEDFRPVNIIGDPNRLHQLYSNLLENTLRYTDSPGLLRINPEFNKERLVIIFEDSGPGVPDESLPLLFKRLYRVDSSRNRKFGGSGLGLSICKSIVTAHNGEIRATRGESGGLRIEIEFQLTKLKEESNE